MSEGEIGNACPANRIARDTERAGGGTFTDRWTKRGPHESAFDLRFGHDVSCKAAMPKSPLHVCKHCGAVYWVGA